MNLSIAELHAASICELARTFPEPSAQNRAERVGQNLPLMGGIREFHGERCGWCDYTVEELRQIRADNQPARRDVKPWENGDNLVERQWWLLPPKARRKALEAAMSRPVLDRMASS